VSADPTEIAATYYTAWKTKDFDTLASLLADEVTFQGPLGTAANRAECLEGLKGLGNMLTDVVIHKTFVDGGDVITWFDLHTSIAPPAAVANWSHIEDGQITRIRVTFDPRELVAAMGG
jgi:SnoaL-like domain